jgi:hypothetical protein
VGTHLASRHLLEHGGEVHRQRVHLQPHRVDWRRRIGQVSQAVAVLGILEQLLDADPAAVPVLNVDGGALKIGHDGRVAVHLPELALSGKAELLLGDGCAGGVP